MAHKDRERGERRHVGKWLRLIWAARGIATITVAALAFYFLFSSTNADVAFMRHADIWIYSVVMWLILAIPYLAYIEIRYQNIFYILAEDELIFRQGVFNTERVIIPYEKIQNVNIGRGVVNRILGTATLKIETAGGKPGEAEADIPSVPHYEQVIEEISELMEKSRKKAGGRGRF